ncbi:hypothetical protein CLV35_1708 [Motilibacter peucedani]|uniref:Uncharacterized protein n=1 Tax=Motilibacter peucedani TaxID=598650 RepID=A0A420XPQ4_9ACTN|nr:hypothetical protein CLV35_1708 [Motilibacter peucedani]
MNVLAALVPTVVIAGAFIGLLVFAFRATDGRSNDDRE